MKKIAELQTQLVFWATILALMLSSCGRAISTNMPVVSTPVPTSDWQPLPIYIYDIPTSDASKYSHYTPSAKFDLHLEFDYPSNWLLTEYTDEIGLPNLFIHDPRFSTLPTPAPSDYHPTPNDFGVIDIWILPSSPGQTADTELESHKEGYSNHFRYTVLTDYKTKIDGQDASVLEYQLKERMEGSPTLMFERRIYFAIETQVYEICFSVAEKERGGEFEQGYEYFFKSIKIVP